MPQSFFCFVIIIVPKEQNFLVNLSVCLNYHRKAILYVEHNFFKWLKVFISTILGLYRHIIQISFETRSYLEVVECINVLIAN